MIKSEILLDSIGANGSAPRLTTWKLTFPRFILAEVNTHRGLSRNYPSSRAIPVLKRMGMVIHDPVIPIEWGLDRPGMQASEQAKGFRLWLAKTTWRAASLAAVCAAWVMVKLDIHKQIANRLLEPFVEVTGLLTGVDTMWQNFFALRAHKDADPHIQALAFQMLPIYNNSVPQVLQPGEWHIPFGDSMPEGLTWDEKIKIAVARAARVSYNTFEGPEDPLKDFKLHDRLASSGHWSAFEHIAQVPERIVPKSLVLAPNLAEDELKALQAQIDQCKLDPDDTIVCNYNVSWDEIGKMMHNPLSGNLPGWIQLRKTMANECRTDDRVEVK